MLYMEKREEQRREEHRIAIKASLHAQMQLGAGGLQPRGPCGADTRGSCMTPRGVDPRELRGTAVPGSASEAQILIHARRHSLKNAEAMKQARHNLDNMVVMEASHVPSAACRVSAMQASQRASVT